MRAGRLDDAHLAWFIAETECAHAFRAWRAGTGNDADMAFCSYLAALDREESAARHLERVWQATEPWAPTLVRRMRGHRALMLGRIRTTRQRLSSASGTISIRRLGGRSGGERPPERIG